MKCDSDRIGLCIHSSHVLFDRLLGITILFNNISKPPHGSDDRMIGVFPEFLAQAVDVDFDEVCGGVEERAPHVLGNGSLGARSTLEAGPLLAGNQTATGGYVELAYQMRDRTTLLARLDLFDPLGDLPGGRERDFTIGSSVHLMHNAIAKAEVHFWKVPSAPKRDYVQAITSLAVVF